MPSTGHETTFPQPRTGPPRRTPKRRRQLLHDRATLCARTVLVGHDKDGDSAVREVWGIGRGSWMTMMRRPKPIVLTARERDVLRAVADGVSHAEIGRRLVIGEASVKTHLLRVFAKLDVSDRTRAVAWPWNAGSSRVPEARAPSVNNARDQYT